MPSDDSKNNGAAPTTAPLTRRGFLAVSSATIGVAVFAAACGDDSVNKSDTADLGEPVDLTTTPDTPSDADQLDSQPTVDAPADTNDADATVASQVFDPASVGLAPEAVFPLGVQSGDPTADGVIVQCLFRGTGDLAVVVFAESPTGDGQEPGVLLARLACEVADGGFVHVDVQSLSASISARFCFISDAGRSRIGAFKTPPAANVVTRVTFGATSCASYTYRPFEVLGTAAGDDLDFFLLLGDTVYADDATTRAEYRGLWYRNLATLEYQALLAAQPVIATWDDHEVDNNWDPETVDAARLVTARGAFFEHLALRRNAANAERIYRSFRFGRLVEVFVLDCRSERRPSTRKSAAAEYISEAQLDWLVSGLTASDAIFKVIANSIPLTKWPALYPGDSQRWEGFAAQRDAVIAATVAVSGVVWIAGDFHFGAVARVDPPGGPAHAVTEVLVGPVAHLNPGLAIVEATGSPQQFLFTTATRNYGRFVAEQDGDIARLSVEHIGPGGASLARHILLEL